MASKMVTVLFKILSNHNYYNPSRISLNFRFLLLFHLYLTHLSKPKAPTITQLVRSTKANGLMGKLMAKVIKS